MKMKMKMKPRSLSRQVLGIVLFAQFGCAIALSAIALLQQRNTRLHALDIRLQGRSDSLLGAIQDAEDPEDNVYIDPLELKLPDEDRYAVYAEDGNLIGHSPDGSSPLLQHTAAGFRDRQAGGQQYRVYERRALRIIDRAETQGTGLRRPVTIVYATPERHLWHEIFEAAAAYLVTVLLAVGLTAALLIALVKRALRPLADLSHAAAMVSAPSLLFATPPSVQQLQELRPLAAALTHTVASLKEAFAKEQRFLGDAAHELKTAVAVVRSTVQLQMLRRRTPEEHFAGLEQILEDNGRVETLVAQMLTSAGAQESTRETSAATDLASIVTQVSANMQSVAEAHGVELRCDTRIAARTAARIPLSPQRASILLSNLILNAIQHSRKGSAVHIAIRNPSPGAVVLEVEDTGSGIGPDALPHVFERFYREDRSRSRATGGAGLGLAICKSIADAVGATIQLESAPGQGTTARVTFIQS